MTRFPYSLLGNSGVPQGWYPGTLAARLLILPLKEVWRGACVAWEVPGKVLPAADVGRKNLKACGLSPCGFPAEPSSGTWFPLC